MMLVRPEGVTAERVAQIGMLPKIGYRARGLLACLAQWPVDEILQRTLVEESPTEGVLALRAALEELADYGYIRRDEFRDGGQFRTRLTVERWWA